MSNEERFNKSKANNEKALKDSSLQSTKFEHKKTAGKQTKSTRQIYYMVEPTIQQKCQHKCSKAVFKFDKQALPKR